jgi:pimeloyl-ACP methyl ester carboxylesterase
MSIDPADLGFSSTTFELPGLSVHAATQGDAGRPLVILLHGFPEGWLAFRQQIRPLAEAGYRVVAPDQRGYNLTSKRGPYDLDTLAADALRLMDACGAREAHWVGHDWGAAVAWRLAQHYPQHVATLSILNVPHPSLAARSVLRGNWRQALRSSYVYFFQLPWLPEWLLRRNGFGLMRRGMERSANPGTFTDEDLDRYQRVWAARGGLTAMLGWYRAFMRRPDLSLREVPRPGSYRMPAQIIWGEKDAALEVGLAEQSARLLANGRLVRLPEATHWVQHDFPERVTGLIVKCLQAA